jgi:hypothetical protein
MDLTKFRDAEGTKLLRHGAPLWKSAKSTASRFQGGQHPVGAAARILLGDVADDVFDVLLGVVAEENLEAHGIA